MTYEKAYKGKNLLLARRELTEEEVRQRLQEYYENTPEAPYVEDIVDECIKSVKLCDVWTDSRAHIAVVYLGRMSDYEKYIIISTGRNYDLVK